MSMHCKLFSGNIYLVANTSRWNCFHVGYNYWCLLYWFSCSFYRISKCFFVFIFVKKYNLELRIRVDLTRLSFLHLSTIKTTTKLIINLCCTLKTALVIECNEVQRVCGYENCWLLSSVWSTVYGFGECVFNLLFLYQHAILMHHCCVMHEVWLVECCTFVMCIVREGLDTN